MSTLKVGGIKHYDLAGDSDTIVLSGIDSAVTVNGNLTANTFFGDGSQLTGIESYDSVKVQGQMDSDFPTRNLNELSNVNVPSPIGGASLVYDSTNSQWVAGTSDVRQTFHFAPDAGTSAITGFDKFGTFLAYKSDSDNLDVFVNGILLIDSDFTKTDNGTITLDTATDSNDEIVIFRYRPFVIAGADLSGLTLNDLTDVTVAAPEHNQRLVWDSSQQSWVAASADVRTQYHFTPAPGTTAITGADKFGAVLAYDVDSDTLDVFLNGILLNDSDYTRTSSGAITLDVATDSNDDVRIIRVQSTRVGETSSGGADLASSTTDNLAEGAVNLYYTTARFDSDFGTKDISSYDSAKVQGQMDSAAVKLTGNQTVAGVKTFSESLFTTLPTNTSTSGYFVSVDSDGFYGEATPFTGTTLHLKSGGQNILTHNAVEKKLFLRTNDVDRVCIEDGGDVGIGTINPQSNLHVYNNLDSEEQALVVEVGGAFSNGSGVSLRRDDTEMGRINAHYFDGMTFYVTDGAGNAASERMRIDADGDVGIGTQTPAYKLEVNGTLGCTSITETSSIRYKENVRDLTDTVIPSLRPVIYDRKDGSVRDEVGLIAEEVSQIVPEVVKFDTLGREDGINYTRLIPYLIDHIQKLEKRVEELENGNPDLSDV